MKLSTCKITPAGKKALKIITAIRSVTQEQALESILVAEAAKARKEDK